MLTISMLDCTRESQQQRTHVFFYERLGYMEETIKLIIAYHRLRNIHNDTACVSLVFSIKHAILKLSIDFQLSSV